MFYVANPAAFQGFSFEIIFSLSMLAALLLMILFLYSFGCIGEKLDKIIKLLEKKGK